MKKIQIRDWWDNKVLYETDVEDDDLYPIRTAVDRASLDGASLDGASLDGASLDGASLVGASLVGASLVGASLDGASLDRASLDRASLVGASLDRASLVRASLVRASLVGASLDGASLVGASLVGASLDRASLVGASLDRASLDNIRADFRSVLDKAPSEILGLLAAIRGGKVDGSCYEGSCACLLGTIANIRHCRYDKLADLSPDSARPAERWFLALRPGITPQNNEVARITERWILEWMSEHGVADPRDALRKLAQDAAAGMLPDQGLYPKLDDAIMQLGKAVIDMLPEAVR